jgi:hypothetical protein
MPAGNASSDAPLAFEGLSPALEVAMVMGGTGKKSSPKKQIPNKETKPKRRASQRVIAGVETTRHRLQKLRGDKKRNLYGLVLDPNSVSMRNYDMTVLIALIYTTLVTPYEVAILKTAYDTRFIVNWAVDSVYIVGMLRSFFTAYRI